jgi:hypothetical protein
MREPRQIFQMHLLPVLQAMVLLTLDRLCGRRMATSPPWVIAVWDERRPDAKLARPLAAEIRWSVYGAWRPTLRRAAPDFAGAAVRIQKNPSALLE